MDSYDVAIGGGSSTGSYFARRLVEAGFSVLVLEAEKED
jgi:flavin-dependent dehydrogenase